MFYDPMIAKLITWAPTRAAAIDAQVNALDQFVIDGISDNVDFLSALMQHPRFRKGDLATDFIADEYPDGFHGAPADAQAKRARRVVRHAEICFPVYCCQARTALKPFADAQTALRRQDDLRDSLPSLANRRPDAYVWPQLAEMSA